MTLDAQTLALVGGFTSLATLAAIARFWVDKKHLYEMLSVMAEISMAIAFSLMDQVFPVVVLGSMIFMRAVWWVGKRAILLALPFALGGLGYVSTEVSIQAWYAALPGIAFLLGKFAEYFFSGDAMRILLLPTHIMWGIHNAMIGYWSGVGHEVAQFLSNSARINISLRNKFDLHYDIEAMRRKRANPKTA